METRPDYEVAREQLSATLALMDIDIKARVALKDSRNADEKYPSLNWKIDITQKRRVVTNGVDYMQGSAHCPAYKKQWGGDRYIKSQAIHLECATGQIAKRAFGNSVYESRRRIDPPSVVDVVQSMLMYSDVLNYRGFAEWADNFGYDTDSRKAESIYRNCLEIALEMRSLFGEPEFTRLQEIASRF